MDWKKIKAEYIAGGTSYRKLAKKYNVSFSTLRKVAAKEQWTELRNKAGAKRDTKIIDSVSDKEAKKAVDIVDVADKLLSKISELMDSVPLDTQSMKHLTSALKDLKDIKGYKTKAHSFSQSQILFEDYEYEKVHNFSVGVVSCNNTSCKCIY